MAKSYLDYTGLQNLVNHINSKTIHSHSYENVTAAGETDETGSVFLFKLGGLNKEWVLKYRVIESLADGTEAQYAEVEIGGYNHNISYTKTSNIIADEDHLSAISNIIAINKNTEDHRVGLNIKNCYSQQHNIAIEIEYLKNCNITFFETAEQLSSFSNFLITQLSFKNNGSKLQGVLTIGDKVYDGTKDVTVPVYDGT